MVEDNGKNILLNLKKKWRLEGFISSLLLALAATAFVSTLLYKILSVNFLLSFTFLLIVSVLLVIQNKTWRISEEGVSRFLNRTEPLLEESTQLLLKQYNSLNFLEQLQARKIELQLNSIAVIDPVKRKLTSAIIIFIISLFISVVLLKVPFVGVINKRYEASKTTAVTTTPEILLPEIENVNLQIIPPSYTGKGAREQSKLNLTVEDGAVVVWNIQTNISAENVKLILNDGFTLSLIATDKKHTNWKAQKLIKQSGFYQVKIENKLSELYKIEVIKDAPPVIIIQSPKQNTVISYGASEEISVKANVADDYGIKASNISATISTGEGEAVKFKEQKLLFSNFTPGSRHYQLEKLIDLKQLGLQPGDQLYFYVSATDNYNQQNKSDVYIITIQDTAQSSSMDGLVNGLDIKPEMFRSERQIIIETEQLIKDKNTISVEEFKKRSDELGVDQKLLRLRYGKFLGEENEPGIGSEHKHDEAEHNDNKNVDVSSEILEQYGHKHDNAEDASFFDPVTKKQLKATLSEMWSAELKLRTFKPKEALPFENKALNLLKDLQQKSRAYVAKTGFKATPLKLDKRLTGDLSKIIEPVNQQDFLKDETATVTIRRALGTLEQLKSTGELKEPSKQILQQAFQQMSARAAANPSVYLGSLSALRKILNNTYKLKDINVAESGLQKISTPAERLPASSNAVGDDNLSKKYFINLSKGNRQ